MRNTRAAPAYVSTVVEVAAQKLLQSFCNATLLRLDLSDNVLVIRLSANNAVAEAGDRRMSDLFIVGALFGAAEQPFYKKPTSRMRVSVTTDPLNLFSTWRNRHGSSIPVCAYLLDSRIEKSFVENLQLSHTHTIQRAADLLHRLPIHPPMAKPMWQTILQLRELGVSLLSEWFDAVAKATVPQFD